MAERSKAVRFPEAKLSSCSRPGHTRTPSVESMTRRGVYRPTWAHRWMGPAAVHRRRGAERANKNPAEMAGFLRALGLGVGCDSAAGVVALEEVEQIFDADTAIGCAGAGAIIDIGHKRAGIVLGEVVEQVLDAHAAVGCAGAGTVIHVSD